MSAGHVSSRVSKREVETRLCDKAGVGDREGAGEGVVVVGEGTGLERVGVGSEREDAVRTW